MTFTPSNTRLTMLSRLRAGKPVFGTFLMLSSAWTARLVAQAGWDVSFCFAHSADTQYVFVDCEHGEGLTLSVTLHHCSSLMADRQHRGQRHA
jgi:2-keto-3-deoxy-L-rhamnonate aldolase RhmA